MDKLNQFLCYKVTNTVTGLMYVGQTSKTLEVRWNKHVGAAFWKTKHERNVHDLQRAIREYGPNVFTIELIESASTLEEVCKLERKYIRELGTFGANGYNMTAGGEGTLNHLITEESRRKMSAAQLGKKRGPRSEEVKKQISETKKMLKHGPSAKCNQRRTETETGTGVPRPNDVKEKIRMTLKGRKRPPEVLEKIRATKLRKKLDVS